jgi:hypothetical protein
MMRKLLAGWDVEIDYCDFCQVLFADRVLDTKEMICDPCCIEKKIPIETYDTYPFRR